MQYFVAVTCTSFPKYLKAAYKEILALLRENSEDSCLAGVGASTKGRPDLSEYMKKSSADSSVICISLKLMCFSVLFVTICFFFYLWA